MNKSKTSILRKKGNQNPSSKQTVSFATTSTSTTIPARSNQNASISNHPHQHQRRGKKYNEMTTQEEDALDPNNNPTQSLKRQDPNTKIRNAKSQRATKRHTTSSTTLDTTDIDIEFDTSGTDFVSGIQGEEMVEDRYSLLHENGSDSRDAAAAASSSSSLFQKDAYTNTSTNASEQECPIEPFNLKSEREDGLGYFDGDTYVFRRNQNPEEEEDAWLDHWDETKNDNDKNKNQNQIHTPTISTKPKAASSSSSMSYIALTKEETYQQLTPLLAPKETVLSALSRYGSIVTREKKQKIKDSASFQALHKVTELCNVCMMKFEDGSNVYDFTREKMEEFLQLSDLKESLKRKRNQCLEGDGGGHGDHDGSVAKRPNTAISTSNGPQEEVQWEYRGNEDNLIHGPYSTQQMIQWTSAGYFVGKMSVDVRIVSKKGIDEISNTNTPTDTENENEKTKEETVNDLLDDLEDSDGEDDTDTNTNTNKKIDNIHVDPEWLRSDTVNFQSYI